MAARAWRRQPVQPEDCFDWGEIEMTDQQNTLPARSHGCRDETRGQPAEASDWWYRFEGPTWLVAALIYCAWGLVTFYHEVLPGPMLLILGAWLCCWHGSLQHETVHGHPTRWPILNLAIAYPPIGLWCPYPIYRDSHLVHHGCEHLTRSGTDPESFYLQREQWARLGRVRRCVRWCFNSLLGRLLLGPAFIVGQLYNREWQQFRRGNFRNASVWFMHVLAVALVCCWLIFLCALPLWVYLLCFVYPGLSLTLLRSFAEHKPATIQEHRSAVIEAGPAFALLFLNNNLHALHHRHPGIPWYRLPGRYRRDRAEILAANGGLLYQNGYAQQLIRYGLKPIDQPVHPLHGAEFGRQPPSAKQT